MRLAGSLTSRQLAEQTLERCQAIARCTETPGSITRTFLSDSARDCHRLLRSWMEELDMRVQIDAMGNLRGVYGSGHQARRLLLGSHLDTVPCAGAYDGVLGVCLALAVLAAVEAQTLSADIEVLGFSEEEGIRFRVPFLGSMAVAGCLDTKLLHLRDDAGCTVAEAIRQFGLETSQLPEACLDERAFAYLEFHIEQGPVLEEAGASLAAVEAIVGQTRFEVKFEGAANHAGTTPMGLRHDALAGAAEWIARVEQHACSIEGLVATVGKLAVSPNASNAIPGQVTASLDVRHPSDALRKQAARTLSGDALKIASSRGLKAYFEEHMDQPAVLLDEQLVRRVEKAMSQIGEAPRRMTSGAGHDAMIMARMVPSVMVFLRSIGGVSHHPAEAVDLDDVEKAIRLGAALIMDLAA